MADDGAVALAIERLEIVERLVREHDAEAEVSSGRLRSSTWGVFGHAFFIRIAK